MKNISAVIKKYFHQAMKNRRNLGEILADLIFFFYKGNLDSIPYPLLLHVIIHYGGWAGVSRYLDRRQYLYQVKVTNAKKIFTDLIIPTVILSVVVFGAFQKNDTFFFGFVQNLLSDIILILLIIYILPKILNPHKKYNLSIVHSRELNIDDKNKEPITISINNIGEEIYKSEEIYWEIFIPSECIDIKDVRLFIGEIQTYEEFGLMWKIYGVNKSPLFINQRIDILRLDFNPEVLYGTVQSPLKIYYELKTINGNIPTIDKVTLDFLGTGVPLEYYPNWAEYPITDLYDPNRFSN